MPQITIEYSRNLEHVFAARELARSIHDQLPALIDTQLASCKTRLVMHDNLVIGDGSGDNAMIHVDLRILPGRSNDQKTRLGEAVMALLESSVHKPPQMKLQLTVEVRELERDHYRKRLI